MKPQAYVVATALMVAAISGCAAVPVAAVSAGMTAASVGAEVYTGGELRAARHAAIDDVYLAVLHALDDVELEVRRQKHEPHMTHIRAAAPAGTAANGPDVAITLIRRAPLITKVRIRIGLLGDPSVSQLLLDRIDERLIAAAAAASAAHAAE